MAIDLADRAMVIAPAAATDQETGIAPAVPERAARPAALVTGIAPGVQAKATAQADLATTTDPAIPATMAG
jgi:hypothetical protein